MSILRVSLEEYVTIRRKLGTQFRLPAIALHHFVDFLEREGEDFITTELALRWALEPSEAHPSTWAERLGVVRRFATWISATDPRNEIPPPGIFRARRRRKAPYIYSEEEFERIMAETAKLPSPTGLRALSYTTLFGLLASTGLRPGEPLALDMSDVDLVGGILAIRKTKFGKSRFVPVHNSTRESLAHYAEYRDRLCPRRKSDAFLVSERGMRIYQEIAAYTFARVSQAIGLRAPTTGNRKGCGPRLQDMRHTFATRRLIEWYRAGLDVGREIPRLATYLGHVHVRHTYWYIEAVPELLELAAEHSNTYRRGDAR